MSSLGERARRRSSLFFGSNFSISSLVKPAPTVSEQSSFSDLKHGVRQNSPTTVKQSTRSKHTPIEPLFQDSYLVSKEYLTSEDEQSAVDSQEPASPTFTDDCDFDDDILGEDGYDKKDSLDDFGLGLAFETYKPSDVARKVSIIVCKPKQVYITPPTSPTSPLFARPTSATISPLRHSFIVPNSTPDSDYEVQQQASYFGSWYAAYDRQNTDSSSYTKSTSRSSRTSSNAGSESSRYTAATTVSNDSMLTSDNPLKSAQRPKSSLGRANAVKRNSNRLSTSFSKSFQAKAAENVTMSSPTMSSYETMRPTTSMSMRPVMEANRPATSASYTPAVSRIPASQIPNFSRLERIPSPPEIPASQVPTLRKKKSITNVWFKRKSMGNVQPGSYVYV